MKTTVIYHSADFDGIFCREIARRFLPDAELIGWNYGDPHLEFPREGTVYVLDLSPDCFWESPLRADWEARLIWIDHHKTAIEKYPSTIPGYRIDGVAACRLAWQWFNLPKIGNKVCALTKEDFIERKVTEPYAVRLAGEYDIWDKRDPKAELFQHGLRAQELTPDIWEALLQVVPAGTSPLGRELRNAVAIELLEKGAALQYARGQEYREVIQEQGFDVRLEGMTYLACNSHELDIRSQLFEAGIKPEHDGLLGFTWNGKGHWRVSLYGVPGKPEIDHSTIAKKYGGGGHRQACGFQCNDLPFALGAPG